MKESSSFIEEKHTGVCNDINDVPVAYWVSSDPSASSGVPDSYWVDTILLVSSATVHAAVTKPVLEDYLSKTSIVDDTSAAQLSSNSYDPTIVEEGSGEGAYQQQNNYYVNDYNAGISFMNENFNDEEDVEHYNDRHYQQQQQLDERHLQDSS